MSKVNRRQEIKKKEELQARFQVAMSHTNNKILNWLQPNNEIAHEGIDNQSFFNLPIIPNGTGLSNIENTSNRSIGDFVNSNEQNFKKFQDNNTSVNLKTTSKPMMALMNKMRNTNRIKIKQNSQNQGVYKKKESKIDNSHNDSDSEKEEEAIAKNRSVKKGSNLLFESKIGKKKGRPF